MDALAPKKRRPGLAGSRGDKPRGYKTRCGGVRPIKIEDYDPEVLLDFRDYVADYPFEHVPVEGSAWWKELYRCFAFGWSNLKLEGKQ
jgi:hypothetical protein